MAGARRGPSPAAAEATGPGKGRAEAFSDGVMAIIITIMVLELKLPDALAHGFDRAALLAFAPRLIAYAMSFLAVAIMWMNHHYLLAALRQTSGGFLWLNNLLLFWMSLIPAATAFLSEHPLAAPAAAIYGGVLTCSSATFTMMRIWVQRLQRETPALARLQAAMRVRSLIATAVYALSAPLAFVSIYLAFACFAIVPAMFFLPQWRTKAMTGTDRA